jgi:glycosyltransferase involved in cell wall biosynthesis
VAIKDSEGLAQALRQLIQDPAARARYGRNGRALAEAHFGIDRITAETLAVYRGGK